MKTPSCNCHSYNQDNGSDLEEVIKLPEKQFLASGRMNQLVSLDSCIALTIQRLWDDGVLTLGCCCGHGKAQPGIVLHESEDPAHVSSLIRKLDDRAWVLLQWKDDTLQTVGMV